MAFSKKISKTEKVTIKGLSIEGDKILDVDGVVVDLNTVVSRAFADGEIFDFVVSTKTDDEESISDED